ncbi:unnamed protein product [Allacma fusca]|uniref:Peptidase aspartic putative domain-containing protein n=1 Tax=Allacma fusca TaxID=39272 RepID=A0A8J2PPA2_9HEXA|nr:unnamed protein product [Allacma fusca]
MSLITEEPPTFSALMEFLEQRARALVTLEKAKESSIKLSASKPTTKPTNVKSHHVSKSLPNYILCKEDHFLFRCQKFQAQTCSKKHHTLIHYDDKQQPSGESTSVTSTVTSLVAQEVDKQVLISTALVKVRDSIRGQQVCRSMLDPGSQVSMITSACVQRLGLPRKRTNVNITGIASCSAGNARGKAELQLTSCVIPSFSIGVGALILSHITSAAPAVPCIRASWDHLDSLTLADPNYSNPNAIDILLEADVYGPLLLDGRKMGQPNTPTAINTSLGWVVFGAIGAATSSVVSLVVQASLESHLQRFWEVEDLPSQQHFTQEEQWCQEHFLESHQREPSGRYVIELPFKPNHPALGQSKERALTRFLHQERRLQTNPYHKSLYVEFMRELQVLGHMIPIPEEKLQCPATKSYYLPHHAVFKWNSTTTKCRVVFDASSQTSSGVSLNDILYPGTTLQQSLFSTLLRFRSHAVPFIADEEKMFRMIGVSSHHWDFQRVIWREEIDQPIREYYLVVLVFGTTCAPYLAVRCLRQCAVDESINFPRAHHIVLRDFYVDDLMSGESSIEEAKRLVNQLQQMLPCANFNLRKWFTSSEELLETIPPKLRGTQTILNLFRSNAVGWLVPITVLPKDLIRQTWQLKLGWDTPVPAFISDQWASFRTALPCIQQIYIPRCVSHPNAKAFQLCGFSDASERAYAACVYVWSMGTESCRLRWLLPSQRLPQRWTTFVANRVAVIQEAQYISWHHVPREINPADCASRRIPPTQLAAHPLWWQGPSFLRDPLPAQDCTDEELPERAKEEERAKKVIAAIAKYKEFSLLERFSSLSSLLRVTAYVLRFPFNARTSIKRKKGIPAAERRAGFLTSQELFFFLASMGESSTRVYFLSRHPNHIQVPTCTFRQQCQVSQPFC